MPCNAFFTYLEHFFKVLFSDPLDHLSKRKKGTCNNLQQNKEKKQMATIQSTFQHIYHL